MYHCMDFLDAALNSLVRVDTFRHQNPVSRSLYGSNFNLTQFRVWLNLKSSRQQRSRLYFKQSMIQRYKILNHNCDYIANINNMLHITSEYGIKYDTGYSMPIKKYFLLNKIFKNIYFLFKQNFQYNIYI